MPAYQAAVSNFTPSLTDDNWILEGDTAGDYG